MKKIYLALAFTHCAFIFYSQDAAFVNPNQSLIQTNPSFAGSNGSVRNQSVYRNMWPNLTGNTVTYYNGIDAYVKPLHGGLAISAKHTDQRNGFVKNSELNLIYAPHLIFKNSALKIIPSIQLSYVQREIDYSQFSFYSVPRRGFYYSTPQSGKKQGLDISAGVLLNYKNFYIGTSVFHINEPDMGVDGLYPYHYRSSLNTAYNLKLNQKTLLNFSAIFSSQRAYTSYQLAVNAIILNRMIAGIGYSSGEVVFLNIGYRANWVSFNLGYDITNSSLAYRNSGAWQLALAFSLCKKEKGDAPLAFEKW